MRLLGHGGQGLLCFQLLVVQGTLPVDRWEAIVVVHNAWQICALPLRTSNTHRGLSVRPFVNPWPARVRIAANHPCHLSSISLASTGIHQHRSNTHRRSALESIRSGSFAVGSIRSAINPRAPSVRARRSSHFSPGRANNAHSQPVQSSTPCQPSKTCVAVCMSVQSRSSAPSSPQLAPPIPEAIPAICIRAVHNPSVRSPRHPAILRHPLSIRPPSNPMQTIHICRAAVQPCRLFQPSTPCTAPFVLLRTVCGPSPRCRPDSRPAIHPHRNTSTRTTHPPIRLHM